MDVAFDLTFSQKHLYFFIWALVVCRVDSSLFKVASLIRATAIFFWEPPILEMLVSAHLQILEDKKET